MNKKKNPLKIAFNYISYSDRFSKEVIQRLKKEGFSEEEVDSTMQRLRDLGLVDDERIAKEFIFSKIRKGWGPERIKTELMRRGASYQIIENSMKEIFSDMDERELIMKAVEKFLKYKKGERVLERLKGFLFRKGFSYDKIIDVMDDLERKYQ